MSENKNQSITNITTQEKAQTKIETQTPTAQTQTSKPQIKKKQKPPKPPLHYQNPLDKPYKVLNITFASKKTFTNFMLASFFIIVIPIIMVVGTRMYLEQKSNISEANKTILTVAPAVLFMNIIMGIYVYMVIKDPTNYSSKTILAEQQKLKLKQKQQENDKTKSQ